MLNYLEKYLSGGKSILRVHVLKKSIVTYYISEDQVIFPMGSKFKVLSKAYIKNTSIGLVQFYDLMYLGL